MAENCEGCPSGETCKNQENCQIQNNPRNHVGRIIGVMSGKGGVGKSTVSLLIARALQEKGFTVGLLDSDITGPSIPKLLGLKRGAIEAEGQLLKPFMTQDGLKVVSMNLLLEHEEQPVVWRGPLLSKAVQQFWTDVLWGELDFLVVDMPPGTADVSLTVMQNIPISGIVMVSTPQDMVSQIVAKAINMVVSMDIPILGMVDNMSYVVCPHCNERIEIFGRTDEGDISKKYQIDLLGEFPMESGVANIAETTFRKLSQTVRTQAEKIAESLVQKTKMKTQ